MPWDSICTIRTHDEKSKLITNSSPSTPKTRFRSSLCDGVDVYLMFTEPMHKKLTDSCPTPLSTPRGVGSTAEGKALFFMASRSATCASHDMVKGMDALVLNRILCQERSKR